MDHFFQIPASAGRATCWRATPRSASSPRARRRIKLGTMVTGVTYRHPGLLVKTVTTLDVLSGGRAYSASAPAGSSASTGPGRPVPAPEGALRAPRGDAPDRPPDVSGDNGPFNGKHYQLAETLNVPQPMSSPHPPILIGGRRREEDPAPRRQIRRAMQHLVGFGEPVSTAAPQAGRPTGALRAEGRAYDAIEKTTLHTLWMTPGFRRRPLAGARAGHRASGQLREAGVDHAIFNIPNVERPRTLQMLAETVIPAAKAL